MIKKVYGKKLWKVVSENTGRSFGKYTSIKLAKKRLRQIEVWKHINK
jgi:hypothetical protein